MAVKTAAARKKIEALRGNIKKFRESREEAKRLDAWVKEQQPEVIALMKLLDPDNVGVVYDPENEEKGAAYVQQNSGSTVWDEEAIIEYLHRKRSRWLACSSRVFDVQKWEAEIAAGSIPKKTANKFMKKQPDPSPFIRFGKIKKENI